MSTAAKVFGVRSGINSQ